MKLTGHLFLSGGGFVHGGFVLGEFCPRGVLSYTHHFVSHSGTLHLQSNQPGTISWILTFPTLVSRCFPETLPSPSKPFLCPRPQLFQRCPPSSSLQKVAFSMRLALALAVHPGKSAAVRMRARSSCFQSSRRDCRHTISVTPIRDSSALLLSVSVPSPWCAPRLSGPVPRPTWNILCYRRIGR